MTYIDTWKNKMKNNGGSITASIRKNADRMYALNFKENDSYRNSIILNSDLTENQIDIRVVNKDSNPNEKRLYLMPGMRVKVGSYIKYAESDDEYIYLVQSVENNLESPCCNATYCNQKIILDKETSIPCVAAGESYGVKLTASNDFITDADTKIKVTVQSNSTTRNIPLNTRFILGFSEHGVYKISDVTVYNEGMLTYICKKDNFREGYDDIKNGIAYNGDLPSVDEPIEYTISGADSIRKGQTETYTISNSDGIWEIEDYSDSVGIISQDSSQIQIKCSVYGDFITIKYLVNKEIKVEKDISLVR
ncbi:hypothetical protein [Paraclostridium bifermentans]|uniref:hypothetical protein n=1 Tax=Paraclostridium bifermentans TaxID=1490 RepID=UPI00189E5D04|nr:hypothetical protein [Paraclostridium bifermentans]